MCYYSCLEGPFLCSELKLWCGQPRKASRRPAGGYGITRFPRLTGSRTSIIPRLAVRYCDSCWLLRCPVWCGRLCRVRAIASDAHSHISTHEQIPPRRDYHPDEHISRPVPDVRSRDMVCSLMCRHCIRMLYERKVTPPALPPKVLTTAKEMSDGGLAYSSNCQQCQRRN